MSSSECNSLRTAGPGQNVRWPRAWSPSPQISRSIAVRLSVVYGAAAAFTTGQTDGRTHTRSMLYALCFGRGQRNKNIWELKYFLIAK